MTSVQIREAIESARKGMYIEGECFLCGKLCKGHYYCHHECAVAYTDELEERVKNIQLEWEQKN